MEARFKLGRQSSLAPEDTEKRSSKIEVEPSEMASGIRLMYLANEGDLEGIKELLDSGVDVNFRDIDQRTALHIAACQGHVDVVQLLLQRGAEINAKDQWGSTPLADAIYYKHEDVVKLLESYGAKSLVPPMHVPSDRQVPEYEIDPNELDFTNSFLITKGTFRVAIWRGTKVAVKTFGDDVIMDEDKIEAFREELSILQKIRHPNVIQFLGAVTQSTPMMIVLEYLPKGDLHAFLNRKGQLKPYIAVKFALDIARGMNYLHEHKPEAIIHRNLEPSNILRDDSGHLKVADFSLGKMVRVSKAVKEHSPVQSEETWRYVAPEVFKKEAYDIKVDVFSFSLILQEMIEGCPPFSSMSDEDVPKAYCAHLRPPFQAPSRNYAYGLKELIEQCWNENPIKRPTFQQIINRLEEIGKRLDQRRTWKVGPLKCFEALKSLRNRNCRDPDNEFSGSSIK